MQLRGYDEQRIQGYASAVANHPIYGKEGTNQIDHWDAVTATVGLHELVSASAPEDQQYPAKQGYAKPFSASEVIDFLGDLRKQCYQPQMASSKPEDWYDYVQGTPRDRAIEAHIRQVRMDRWHVLAADQYQREQRIASAPLEKWRLNQESAQALLVGQFSGYLPLNGLAPGKGRTFSQD